MNNTTIVGRLNTLRRKMAENSIDMVIISSSDSHGSEYVAPFFQVSEFFSGCTSDNVMLLILADDAYLWTDARYFLSAERELNGTGITLMKSGEAGVPTLNMFLDEHLKEGMTLAFDGNVLSCERTGMIRRIAAKCGANINAFFDPAGDIWTDRPGFPNGKIITLPVEMTGKSCREKIETVSERIKNADASSMVLSKTDDIMWLFNIRGEDIPFNPVALSYCIIRAGNASLYVQRPDELKEYAERENFTVKRYDTFFDDLKDFEEGEKVLLDYRYCSDAIISTLFEKGIHPVQGIYPTSALKTVKNEAELAGIRDCYIRDSAVLCSFLCYVQGNVGKEEMTEISLAEKLNYMRSTIEDFKDLSFETISAYGANAAIVHYEPKPETNVSVKPEGLYLVDSGGQYQSGTTDVTRTISLGDISEEMKRDFTLVAIANLRLLNAKFLQGCTGANIDMYARSILWENGADYKHGTGHGIGSFLNVHEGPQNIAWKIVNAQNGQINGGAKTVFEPGMITSDEPGIYRDGKYGIRTETIIECVEDEENEYGKFLSFRPLTYVPIDLKAMDLSMLDESDRRKLNRYHREVYEKISPLLEEAEELEWLKNATREV